jgi:hypothetical protein
MQMTAGQLGYSSLQDTLGIPSFWHVGRSGISQPCIDSLVIGDVKVRNDMLSPSVIRCDLGVSGVCVLASDVRCVVARLATETSALTNLRVAFAFTLALSDDFSYVCAHCPWPQNSLMHDIVQCT